MKFKQIQKVKQSRLILLVALLYSVCVLWGIQVCWLKVLQQEQDLCSQKQMLQTSEDRLPIPSTVFKEEVTSATTINQLPYLTQEVYGIPMLLKYLQKDSIKALHIETLRSDMPQEPEVGTVVYRISYETTNEVQQQLMKTLATQDYFQLRYLQCEFKNNTELVELEVGLWYRKV